MSKKTPDKRSAVTDQLPVLVSFGQREDVPVAVHGIDATLVDERALDVVCTLKQAGFDAYIVGGAVRDLLLGLRPKDFDVATSATPEEVKALFRRAFIIGKRFRIVHVIYGKGREHEVIEVSTLRAHLDNTEAPKIRGNEHTHRHQLEHMKHAVDASGRVLRDNVWGPIEQDAARRDFTINAMYYDPETETVVDFHHGIRDVKHRVLRIIGDPVARYREDPVRMIRAVRFMAKFQGLGFKIEEQTQAPLLACLPLLADVPQSRLFDEMLKLLQTGHALASIATLRAMGLARGIYPLLDLIVERADEPFVLNALQDTDRRVSEDKSVVPSFLLSCVLWRDVLTGWQQRLQTGMPTFPALQEAVDQVFEFRIGDVSGRGRLSADMREIWLMQPRFEKRTGATPFSLVQQPRFRAAFDFLSLRAQDGELSEELAHWWETFSLATDAVRRDMVDEIRREQQRVKAKAKATVRVFRQNPVDAEAAAGAVSAETVPTTAEGEAEAPVKKRRRRKRKSNASNSNPGPAGQSGNSEVE